MTFLIEILPKQAAFRRNTAWQSPRRIQCDNVPPTRSIPVRSSLGYLSNNTHLPFAEQALNIVIACTSTTVRPVDPVPALRHICIRENPKVLVDDFVPVTRDALSSRGIRSEVFSGAAPAHCDALLTYIARRRWDLGSYLSHAEIRIERDGLQIGYAEYHLRGGGGYSVFKWQGTRTKMEPVLDELLGQIGH